MKNHTVINLTTMKNLITMALIAAFGAVTTLTAGAADQQPTPKPIPLGKKEDRGAKEQGTKAQRAGFVPFHGKLDSVDKTAKSVKIGDRIFQVVSTTKITKDGTKPGTLDDAKVGESVAGAYHEADGGNFQLVSLRLGPKPEKRTSADKKK